MKEFCDTTLEEVEMFQVNLGFYTLAKDKEECWHGSPAEHFLKEDVENGNYVGLKPKEFWLTRPEYQKFPLKKFCGHVHQETRSKLETNYWLVKRKKQKKKLSLNFNDSDEEDDFFLNTY